MEVDQQERHWNLGRRNEKERKRDNGKMTLILRFILYVLLLTEIFELRIITFMEVYYERETIRTYRRCGAGVSDAF